MAVKTGRGHQPLALQHPQPLMSSRTLNSFILRMVTSVLFTGMNLVTMSFMRYTLNLNEFLFTILASIIAFIPLHFAELNCQYRQASLF